jgi:hypothetical protein
MSLQHLLFGSSPSNCFFADLDIEEHLQMAIVAILQPLPNVVETNKSEVITGLSRRFCGSKVVLERTST